MNIAGVGPAELLLILIVALVVFGPQRLPQIAKDVGKSIGKWRQALEEIESVADAPMKEMKEIKEALDPASMEKKLQESVQKIVTPESPHDRETGPKATDEQTAEQEATVEQAAEREATDEQPAEQEATAEQAADHEATDEQPAEQEATSEQAAEHEEKPESGGVAK
jgi:TatA/E family protein of Tat protein translocase